MNIIQEYEQHLKNHEQVKLQKSILYSHISDTCKKEFSDIFKLIENVHPKTKTTVTIKKETLSFIVYHSTNKTIILEFHVPLEKSLYNVQIIAEQRKASDNHPETINNLILIGEVSKYLKNHAEEIKKKAISINMPFTEKWKEHFQNLEDQVVEQERIYKEISKTMMNQLSEEGHCDVSYFEEYNCKKDNDSFILTNKTNSSISRRIKISEIESKCLKITKGYTKQVLSAIKTYVEKTDLKSKIKNI